MKARTLPVAVPALFSCGTATPIKQPCGLPCIMVALRTRNAMNPAQRALWYVESHLAEPMTLDEIAAVSGVSRFHIVRVCCRDRPAGDAVRARAAAERSSAESCERRAGHPVAGAGGGLRLRPKNHPP